jgi:DNA-binding Lrp family transcriptional regulator
MMLLVACVPKNLDAARDKLAGKGYTEISGAGWGSKITSFAQGYVKHVKEIYEANTDSDYIVVIWFNDSKKAKEFLKIVNDKETWFEEIKAVLGSYSTDYTMPTQSGKVVYFGTNNAIKDLKS